MASAVESAPSTSEVIYNVGRVLAWLARTPDEPDRSWFTPSNLTRGTSRETRQALEILQHNLRKRHEVCTTIASGMMDKLQAEIESTPPGTIMDPEGSGVKTLEGVEEYFRVECEGLDSIRNALDRSGGSEAFGPRVFEELQRLQQLFAKVVAWAQETRWRLMINDGTLAQTTGRAFKSGADLVSALDDS